MITIRKMAVLGLVACLTLGGTTGVLALNSNAGEQAPTIKSERITAKSKFANIEIEYPVITGLHNNAFQAQLNNSIKQNALKEKEKIEQEAAAYAQLAKQENWQIRPFQLKIDYSVKNTEDILSFTITTYTFTGGAHGDQRTKYYNIDLKDNKLLTLADLFQKNSNYQEIINAGIKKQIAEEVASGEGMYFGMEEDSPIEGFTSISDNQAFYIEDGNLVIAFAKYEIAPGVMGEPTFDIPLAQLKELLKEEYRTLVD